MRATFSDRLASLVKGGTKGDFAAKIGVPPQQLSRYLRGQLPDTPVLKRIAEVTGRSVDWLLTGREISEIWRDLASALEQVRAFNPKAEGVSLAESTAEYRRLYGIIEQISEKIEQQEAARGVGLDPAARRLFEHYEMLSVDERETLARCAEALRDGQADVRQHLIGQLKLIEDTVRLRAKQKTRGQPSGAKRAGEAS